MSGVEGVTAIALVGMGEMGSGIAWRLVENGAREGRRSRGSERGRGDRSGQHRLGDRVAGHRRSVAEHIAPVIARSANKPTYIECNAIAPATSLAFAELFEVRGLPFGDASILGAAPKPTAPAHASTCPARSSPRRRS